MTVSIQDAVDIEVCRASRLLSTAESLGYAEVLERYSLAAFGKDVYSLNHAQLQEMSHVLASLETFLCERAAAWNAH